MGAANSSGCGSHEQARAARVSRPGRRGSRPWSCSATPLSAAREWDKGLNFFSSMDNASKGLGSGSPVISRQNSGQKKRTNKNPFCLYY
jgi:hypothetical protein